MCSRSFEIYLNLSESRFWNEYQYHYLQLAIYEIKYLLKNNSDNHAHVTIVNNDGGLTYVTIKYLVNYCAFLIRNITKEYTILIIYKVYNQIV